MLLVVGNTDLVRQEGHGGNDTFGNTFNDESIDVINVSDPSSRFFVWLDVLSSIFHHLVDLFTVVSDVLKLWGDQRLMGLLKIFWWNALVLSLEKWLLPFAHHVLHLSDVILHFLDKFIDNRDISSGLVDEFINARGVPFELANTSCEGNVHLLDSISEEWLLDWEKSGENIVVHVDDNFEVTGLRSVDVDFLVKERGSLWDLDVEEEQVLDFSQESDKDWVEVDSDESLDGEWGLLSVDQEFVEFFLGVFLNTLLPKLDLDVVVLSKVFAKGGIELLDIFVLLSILNRLGKKGELVHWLPDSLVETLGPVESTSDWRQVVRDGGSLVDLVNQGLTFHEDGSDGLKIVFVELKKSNVLLFKLILDDWSVKKSLEGVKELELTNNGVGVIETLGEDGSESSLELLDSLSELEEVVVEVSLLDVHDVVRDGHEVFNSLGELIEDPKDSGGQGLTFGVTNVNLLQLAELDNS